MPAWNATDLAAIGRGTELRVAADRPDGTRVASRIVWHLVVDGHLFIRSVRGENGAWYRAVRRTGTGAIDVGGVHAHVTFVRDDGDAAAIDDAYRAKYGNGSPVRSITSAVAAATTLRIEPG